MKHMYISLIHNIYIYMQVKDSFFRKPKEDFPRNSANPIGFLLSGSQVISANV